MRIKTDTIFVKNNGGEIFRDRYNGEDFEISPGAFEEMTIECATLCFGFGEEDKSRCLRRKGWPYMKRDGQAIGHHGALEQLSKFSFHMTEEEALGHSSNKAAKDPGGESHSSAPVVGGAPGEASASPAGAVQSTGGNVKGAKRNPLEKLAAAQPAAG
jgi:hypothetical protein